MVYLHQHIAERLKIGSFDLPHQHIVANILLIIGLDTDAAPAHSCKYFAHHRTGHRWLSLSLSLSQLLRSPSSFYLCFVFHFSFPLGSNFRHLQCNKVFVWIVIVVSRLDNHIYQCVVKTFTRISTKASG